MHWSSDDILSWNKEVGAAIDTIGTDDFPMTIARSLQCVIPNISIILFVSPKDQQPHLSFDNYPKRIHSINTNEWLSGAYLLDPFYIRCFDGSPQGLYHLSDVAPEGFLESEYYHLYYHRTLCVDEACYLTHVNDDLRVSLSVARIEGNKPFENTEIEKLRSISPIVTNVLKKHFQQVNLSEDKVRSQLHSQLITGLKAFGTSILTSREQDMIQLILHGHSSKSIARELNISIDTVKMHRKNAYTKLNIATQAELFSLVLNTLPCVETAPDKDPLKVYLENLAP